VAPPMSEADFNDFERLKSIAQPGYQAQPRTPAPPGWWAVNGPRFLGGGTAAPAGDALTPGARAALGLGR
jgi:hypothetical protein